MFAHQVVPGVADDDDVHLPRIYQRRQFVVFMVSTRICQQNYKQINVECLSRNVKWSQYFSPELKASIFSFYLKCCSLFRIGTNSSPYSKKTATFFIEKRLREVTTYVDRKMDVASSSPFPNAFLFWHQSLLLLVYQ